MNLISFGSFKAVNLNVFSITSTGCHKLIYIFQWFISNSKYINLICQFGKFIKIWNCEYITIRYEGREVTEAEIFNYTKSMIEDDRYRFHKNFVFHASVKLTFYNQNNSFLKVIFIVGSNLFSFSFFESFRNIVSILKYWFRLFRADISHLFFWLYISVTHFGLNVACLIYFLETRFYLFLHSWVLSKYMTEIQIYISILVAVTEKWYWYILWSYILVCLYSQQHQTVSKKFEWYWAVCMPTKLKFKNVIKHLVLEMELVRQVA